MYNNICLKGVLLHITWNLPVAITPIVTMGFFYLIDFDILSPVSLNMNRYPLNSRKGPYLL